MKQFSFGSIFIYGLLLSLLVSAVCAAPGDKQQRRGFDSRARSGSGYQARSQSQGGSKHQKSPYDEKAGQKKFNHNWSALDRELFHLNDKMKADPELGPSITFYSWLEIPRKASMDEVTKAYKKMSRKFHPDKVSNFRERSYKQQQKEFEKLKKQAEENGESFTEEDFANHLSKNGEKVLKSLTGAERKKEYKLATDRFARLGLVYKILGDVEARERYDFFLDHGFPKLKGADYFYSRYRPGVLFVFVFVYLFVGIGHYVSLAITASQHRRHMTNIIGDAKEIAWPSGIPASSTRTVVHPSNGKVFKVYPDGKVSLIDDEGGNLRKPLEYPLDITEIADPHWKDTLLYTIPMRLWHAVVPDDGTRNGGKKLGKKDEKSAAVAAAAKKHVDTINGVTSTESEPAADGEKNPVIKGASKVGGRRRK